MRQEKTKKLVTSAMLIALGTAISFLSEYIPFLNLPFGGTVTLASLLPLVLISVLYGLPWGLLSGFVYSLLQMAVGFKTVSGLFLPNSSAVRYMVAVRIPAMPAVMDSPPTESTSCSSPTPAAPIWPVMKT